MTLPFHNRKEKEMKTFKIIVLALVCFVIIAGAEVLKESFQMSIAASATGTEDIDQFELGAITSVRLNWAIATTGTVSMDIVRSGITNNIRTILFTNATSRFLWLPESRIFLISGDQLRIGNATTNAATAWIDVAE